MLTDTILTLKLPEGYSFADLKLRRCDSDSIDLDMNLVERICKLNALDCYVHRSLRLIPPQVPRIIESIA
jgi:hypothetical protein